MLRKLSKHICQLSRGAKEFTLFQTLKLGRKKRSFVPLFCTCTGASMELEKVAYQVNFFLHVSTDQFCYLQFK